MRVIIFVSVVLAFSGQQLSNANNRFSTTNTKRSDASERKSPLIKVSLGLVDPLIVLNQPVVLNLQIRNGCGEAVSIDLGTNRTESIELNLTFPDGKRKTLQRLVQQGLLGFGASGLVSIERNKTYSQKILLNEWISQLPTGRYSLEARLPAVRSKLCAKKFLETAKLTFEISVPNPERLSSISGQLLAEIIKHVSVDNSLLAARELALIMDPVAEPYQQRALLAEKGVEITIIETLRRIGSNQSATVLMNGIKSKPSAEWVPTARYSLETIAATTTDSTLRQRIMEFLEDRKNEGLGRDIDWLGCTM